MKPFEKRILLRAEQRSNLKVISKLKNYYAFNKIKTIPKALDKYEEILFDLAKARKDKDFIKERILKKALKNCLLSLNEIRVAKESKRLVKKIKSPYDQKQYDLQVKNKRRIEKYKKYGYPIKYDTNGNVEKLILPVDHHIKRQKAARDLKIEEYRRRGRDYKKQNMGKVCALNTKRYAGKIKRTPKWLTKEDLRQMELMYIEASRLSKETGVSYQVDHIIPLQGKSVSGLHVPSNLQILRADENIRKGNKFTPGEIPDIKPTITDVPLN